MNITLPALMDAHVHFREFPQLKEIALQTARYCEYAVVMPNLSSPILTPRESFAYKNNILKATEKYPHFIPLTTVQLIPDALEMNFQVKDSDVIGYKLYTRGTTTNSWNGFSHAHLTTYLKSTLYPLLEILQSLDLVLMIHGEMPDVFVIEREREFLPVLDRICHDFPRLRVVLEHATTRDALGLLDECPNLAVSLTYHHLVNTLDDVVGDKLQPHNFCKPIPKTPFDREALLRAALSANPRVFLGSDSAPHSIPNKESCGCAGCFTAPFLVERLVDLFDRCGALTQLANFASCNARSFYRLPSPTFELTVEKSPTFIPAVTVDGVKNFAAGSTLNWTLL